MRIHLCFMITGAVCFFSQSVIAAPEIHPRGEIQAAYLRDQAMHWRGTESTFDVRAWLSATASPWPSLDAILTVRLQLETADLARRRDDVGAKHIELEDTFLRWRTRSGNWVTALTGGMFLAPFGPKETPFEHALYDLARTRTRALAREYDAGIRLDVSSPWATRFTLAAVNGEGQTRDANSAKSVIARLILAWPEEFDCWQIELGGSHYKGERHSTPVKLYNDHTGLHVALRTRWLTLKHEAIWFRGGLREAIPEYIDNFGFSRSSDRYIEALRRAEELWGDGDFSPRRSLGWSIGAEVSLPRRVSLFYTFDRYDPNTKSNRYPIDQAKSRHISGLSWRPFPKIELVGAYVADCDPFFDSGHLDELDGLEDTVTEDHGDDKLLFSGRIWF